MFLLCLLLAFLWKPWQHCDQGQHDTNAVLLHVSYLFSCKNHDNIVSKVSMTLSQFYFSSLTCFPAKTMTTLWLRSAWPWASFISRLILAFLQKPWQHCDWGQHDLEPVLFLISYLFSCKNRDNIATEVSMTLSQFYFMSHTCFPAKKHIIVSMISMILSQFHWVFMFSCKNHRNSFSWGQHGPETILL